MDKKNYLLLKFLAENKNNFYSHETLPINIKSYFDTDMELPNCFHQLKNRNLIDESKSKTGSYKINEDGEKESKNSPTDAISFSQNNTYGDNSPISGRDTTMKNIKNKSIEVNEETSESKELTKIQLQDFPKNKWYRHWGFIVSLLALILLLLLWIIDKS